MSGPDFAKAELERGRHLIDLKRYELSIQALDRALAADPNCAEAHALLSICHVEQRNKAAALDAVRTAISISPEYAHAHYLHSFVHYRYDDYPQARKSIREALRIEPESAPYLYHAALIAFFDGQSDEAEEFVLKARARDPRHLGAGNLHVRLMIRRKKFAEAEEEICRVLRVNPEYAWSHRNRGEIAVALGNYTQAVKSYREALRLDPNDRESRVRLIAALKRRNFVLRFLYWLYDAPVDPIIHAVFRGIPVSTAVAIVPALALAVSEGPSDILENWILYTIGGVAALFPLHALIFILFHWFGTKLVTLFLCLDPLGRAALTWEEKTSAKSVVISLSAAVAFLTAAVVFLNVLLLCAAGFCLLQSWLLPWVLGHAEGPRRTVAAQ